MAAPLPTPLRLRQVCLAAPRLAPRAVAGRVVVGGRVARAGDVVDDTDRLEPWSRSVRA